MQKDLMSRQLRYPVVACQDQHHPGNQMAPSSPGWWGAFCIDQNRRKLKRAPLISGGRHGSDSPPTECIVAGIDFITGSVQGIVGGILRGDTVSQLRHFTQKAFIPHTYGETLVIKMFEQGDGIFAGDLQQIAKFPSGDLASLIEIGA